MTTPTLTTLHRIRWAVRATLVFGVAASVAANILHANGNPISQTIAAWPPLALLLTVELVSRVPVHRRLLAAVRVIATMVISGIAAWVSYWHMTGVTSKYGEVGASPYLLPVSVDGLIVVASISLVELASRIRTLEDAPSTVVGGPSAPVGDGPGTVPSVVVDHEVNAELVSVARDAADSHRTETGRDITRDQLQAALHVSNATAGELLQTIRSEMPRPHGTPSMIGELTR
jgi:hypothetical protein